MDDLVPDDELAYHEAGHAVVEVKLGTVPNIVTIIRSGNEAGSSGHTGGYKQVHAPGNLDQMTVSYAGYAAHVKYAPGAEERARRGAHTDFEKAERCMRVLPLGPGETEALVKRKREEAARLVEQHWPTIQLVAQALIAEKTIDSVRLRALIEEP